jgi:cytochrome c
MLVKWSLIILLVLFSCNFSTPEVLSSYNSLTGPARGKRLLSIYGCASCHQIKGLSGNPGSLGPSLENWSKRKYIIGHYPNLTKYLIKWIADPKSMDASTAMPDLGVSDSEARDMASYLYQQ